MAGKSEGVSRFLGSLQFTEQLGKNMPALSRARPDLVRGIEAGDQEAMLEAYRWIVSQGERVTSPKGMRALRKADPESARQVEAWRAGDEDYIPVGDMAAKLDAPPSRQLELPMRSPEDEIRALIPTTRRGPGVPVGPPSGGPSTGLIPAPLRGLPAPESQRALTPAQGAIAAQLDRALSTDVDLPGLPGPRPRVRVWQDPPRRLDGDVGEGLPRIRVIDAEPPRRGFNWKPAAAAAAAGGGIYLMSPREEEEPALTSTAGTADLKAETSPPPAVATQEEAPVAPPAMGPRERAHAMIKELNDMRRAAGGEVPQARAMMAEINRLLAESNQQRNAPGYDPQPRTDPHNQALRLTQELNDMRRRAGGEVPQAKAIMREIARLNALGDQMVNQRTAGRRVG
jgi:hypothetical protein